MKKSQVLLLAFVVAAFLMSGAAFASFPDVEIAHENFDAINYVQDEGIVDGYEDGTYRPDREINRAEFTKIIVNAVVDENDIDGSDCFPDIGTQWFSSYVCTAKAIGIIDGYPDGTFKPSDEINFVEAAKIIVNGFQYDHQKYSDSEDWFVGYVDALALYNAIPTTVDGFDHKISRGEMSEMIYRLLGHVVDKDSQSYETLADGGVVSKILLTEKNNYDINVNDSNNCETDFNIGPTDTYVWYKNEQKGLRFKIPYDPAWGTDLYEVAPYFETDFSVSFGGLYVSEACSWASPYSVSFYPAEPLDDVLLNLEESESSGFIDLMGTEMIGGHEVVKLVSFDLCASPSYVIPGKDANYTISTTCSGDQDADFAYMADVIESMQFFDPPMVNGLSLSELADDDPSLGSPNALVTVVEFTDFQCPSCIAFHESMLPMLMEDYIDTGYVRFVMRDFPLSMIHSNAELAALSAECVDELLGDSAYFGMAEQIFAGQDDWSSAEPSDALLLMSDYAQNEGVELMEFLTCYDQADLMTEIDADVADGNELGIDATPTFFVNGEMVVGVNYNTLEAAIIGALTK